MLKTYLFFSISTGTVISLANVINNYCNMGAANATTTYTTTGTVLGGKAKVLINTTAQPTITGGTLISGATWTTGVNMYMIVEYLGTARGVEYFFLDI